MNLFELIILLIFFLAPALGRLFGRKAPDRPAPQRQEESPHYDEDDPFGEALRQIREALGEPVAEDAPAKVPEAVPEPKPVPVPRLVKTRPETDFHGLGAFEHDAHGFGPENPLSEQVFERQPAFVTSGSTAPIRKSKPERVDLTTPLEVKKPAPGKTGPRALVRLLRDPQRAREALVLHEVLGPPRSRSRRR